jgi:hypothetical protein
MPQPKGELETVYGSPWGGVDYSRPYNVIDPQFLAPGSINTSQDNGFLNSAPWVASSPFSTAFASGEFVIGVFPTNRNSFVESGLGVSNPVLLVTNIGVYISQQGAYSGGNRTRAALNLLHTWTPGSDFDDSYLIPGATISFAQVNGVVYFTGLMLRGIFSVTGTAFAQATGYVTAAYLAELGGYLIAAECRFPTGGGTGTDVLPTVAWSGPGEYAGSGPTDPWDPVNQLGGGFNLLADVPDQITGLANLGRSGLIFRNSGLSQMDPNPGTANSGLEPFTFYHLWASQQGVGAAAGTVAQFGQQVEFLSSDNVYILSISGGLQAVGPRVIQRILSDFMGVQNRAGLTNVVGNSLPSWYFASIICYSGELHYLLCFSSYTLANAAAGQTPTPASLVYDYNIAENAWHVWDLQQYLQVGGSGQPFLFLSTPITQVSEVFTGTGGVAPQIDNAEYFLFGAFTAWGPVLEPAPSGQLFQIVPFNYDFASNPITPYIAALYQPLSVPKTTIVLRGEVISLGHKVSTRRLRVQADNAPMPTVGTGAQQQATVTFTGMIEGAQNAKLAWTDKNGKVQPYMQGNYPAIGLPIQTYYGSLILSDEMVQPSVASFVADPSNPWQSMAAFRIATMSLILVDATSTTQ